MKYLLYILSSVIIWKSTAQADKYQVTLDLTAVANDQIPVTTYTPQVAEEEVEFHMAKIVPGTYSISDFGRFLTEFTALDASGDTLQTEKISTNRWVIKEANRLAKITYLAHDTFDRFDGYGGNYIFEPGGTNIEEDRQVFVINTFGFVGYLEGYKFKPYELTIKHPAALVGATALESLSISDSVDVFNARDFNFLADGPLMYSVPDIATKQLANAEVVVSVYSPNKKLSADDVMDGISDLMEAQSEYLGGELPVERYAYLIYLLDRNTLSGGMGALEHSTSSVYALPDATADQLGQTIRDVAAHEFFHIVTPLNIHSEEIGNFNYIDPKMSKHLWLYEGCTEYAAMHVQVKHGLYDRNKFLSEIKGKIEVRDKYPTDVAFTAMSENILDPKYEPMYVNVYYKGALIAMALDLSLLKYSDGKYDLQSLMRDLAKKYGPERSFKDNELFDEIAALTYPEIGAFLETYVGSNEPLPLEDVLSYAGVSFAANKETESFTLGNIALSQHGTDEIAISDISQMNEFGKSMGYKKGDVILEVQGQVVNISTANYVLDNYSKDLEVGDNIKVKVRRKVRGKDKKVTLKGKAMTITKTETNALTFDETPTAEQLTVREAWLSAN